MSGRKCRKCLREPEMPVQEHVAQGAEPSGHVCQFFDSDESRADAVAVFVADGLRQGDRVLAVVRPVQWVLVTERLSSAGIDSEREVASGTLVVKDAVATLRRLSRHGAPDQAAFDETVGTAVRRLAELGRLRAYGEMVDILAQRGELPDALK